MNYKFQNGKDIKIFNTFKIKEYKNRFGLCNLNLYEKMSLLNNLFLGDDNIKYDNQMKLEDIVKDKEILSLNHKSQNYNDRKYDKLEN